jgi:outer membrane protein TolC
MSEKISRNVSFVVVLFLFWPACVAAQQAERAPEVNLERLSLRQALGLAVQNSRELALARVRYTMAQNAAGVNRSQFLPNLFAGSAAAGTRGIPATPGGQAPSVFNLAYTQTLFDGPRRGQLRASEERAEIRRLEIDRIRDTILIETASVYLELANVRHALQLLQAERASATRIVQYTELRAGEGLELPIEVTRAQLIQARIEHALIRLEGREESLEARLHQLTGVAPDKRIEVTADELPLEATQPVSELVALAVQNNIELRQAEHERRAREQRLKGERNGYWPTLELFSQYSLLSRFNNFADFFNRFERHNVNAGVRINIPIFSARTNAATKLAESELAEADLVLQNQRAQLDIEVRQQARRVREQEAASEVTRLELKLAQENLRIVQAQFEQGRVSLRELENARLEEHNRWRDFLDAKFERQKAQLELLRMTGQLSRIF